jgi:small subunit ribosomal protein S18
LDISRGIQLRDPRGSGGRNGNDSGGGGGRFARDGRSKMRRNDPQRRKRNPLGDIDYIDYTNIKLLGRFINDQGRILPKRITGVSAKQQRMLSRAIKYARHLALLPFVAEDTR